MKRVIKILVIVLLMSFVLVSFTGCEKDAKSNEETEGTMDYLNSKSNSKSNKSSSKWSDAKKFLNDVKALTPEETLANAEKQVAAPEKGETVAIIHVKDFGDIKVKFFENIAPKAVENFVTHSKEGYYDGLTFHRVMNEFMIQGGDPLGTGTGGETIYGEDIGEELDKRILPYRGALCMASRGTGTVSIGSQFYIVQAHYSETKESWLDYYNISNLKEAYKIYEGDLGNLLGYGQYTTFGQVIEGMDVVDKIAAVETDPESDKPLESVVVESIEITEY